MTKEDAIKRIEDFGLYHAIGDLPHSTRTVEAFEMAIAALKQPQRMKGKWIDEGFYADGHGAHAFRCSECGGHIIEYDVDPFCRWCGADMRGREPYKGE